MARYIDADKLLEEVKRGGHALQEWGTLGVCCVIERQPTADVVPKSEVAKVLDEIEKTIRGALVLVGFSYKHNPKEIQCKKECYEDFLGYIAELKKKYTEEKK